MVRQFESKDNSFLLTLHKSAAIHEIFFDDLANAFNFANHL